MRTEIGRPNSSMRLRAWTAMSNLGGPAPVRARAQSVADHLLEPADRRLDPGPLRVAGRFLPRRASVSGDAVQMAVALRGCRLGRLARHGRGTRRHDDRRFRMALGDHGGHAVLVVSAIGGERRRRCRHLVEQGADRGTVVHLLRGQHRRDDLAGVGVHADVQPAPGPARLGAVLLDQPLARAAELEARAVHQQVQGLAVPARLRSWRLQRLRPAAKGGVVRHSQIEPEQADDGADQTFCLAQGQAEHRPERQRRQDCQR